MADYPAIALSEFMVGKLYLLVGGDLMRYQGPYGGDNYAPLTSGACLAFSSPLLPVSSPAVGYSANAERVLKQLTAEDIQWLIARKAALLSRNLTAEAKCVARAIQELQP